MTRTYEQRPVGGLALLDLVGGHRDRMRQLLACHREQLLAQQLGREERFGLVGDHALRVVVRTGRAAATPARRAARRRRRRRAPRAARTRRSRRARPTPARDGRRSARATRRRPCSPRARPGCDTSASRAATNRSPGPIGALASMRKHTTSTSPSVVERPVVRALAEQRARLVHAGRVEEDDLGVGGGAHSPDLRARRLRPVGDDRDLAADDLVQQRRLADVRSPDERHEPRAELAPASLGARSERRSFGRDRRWREPRRRRATGCA